MTWLTISDKESKYFRDQIHKRWHAFNLNLNCSFAVLVSLLTFRFLGFPEFPLIWLLLFFVSLISFGWNALQAYLDVKNLDNIAAQRFVAQGGNEKT